MIKELNTVGDLIKAQIEFQYKLNNSLPNEIVSFENVQQSLSHNIFQEVETQEFFESLTTENRKEELVDALLFMMNKYIYLGIQHTDFSNDSLKHYYNENNNISFSVIDSVFKMEQSLYISFIRKNCIFKPWKSRNENDNCVNNKGALRYAFESSLSCFSKVISIVFDSYEDFCNSLLKKLDINIDRQNSGY